MKAKSKNILIAALIIIVVALAGFLALSEYEGHGSVQSGSGASSGTPYQLPPQSSWKASTDSATGITFTYPAALGTNYLSAVDWPPAFQVITGKYICTVAGVENAPAGKTEQRTINGTQYCVTTEGEGAAGSVYTQYAYAFPKDATTIIMTFSLKSPQCANYDEPKQSECKTEEATFSADTLADKIAHTVKLP